MPTYEYACEKCGHHFEEFQSITAKPLKKCPACGTSKLQRLIGAGAGVIFKGSGFYQTDYRSDSYRKAAAADKSTPSAAPTETSSGDAKKSDAPAKTETGGKSEPVTKSESSVKTGPSAGDTARKKAAVGKSKKTERAA